MSGPTEFTLESVRQYMLAQDGRVTNHELVKYFKAWLTSPTEKESARQRFKEYVNTLATIKQENGEKYLMLKKRFYPNFDDEPAHPQQQPQQMMYQQQQQQRQPQFTSQRSFSSMDGGPSLLDEVMAGYQSMSRPPPQQHQMRPPQQYQQQPHPHLQQQMQQQSYPMHNAQHHMQQQPRSYDQQQQQPPQQRRMLPNTPQYRQSPPMGQMPSMSSMPPSDLGLPTPASHYSASPTHSQRSSYASLHQAGLPEPPGGGGRVPPPYRPPPYRPAPPPAGQQHRPLPQQPNDLGLPVSSHYGLPPGPPPSMSRQSSYSSPAAGAAAMMLGSDPPPLPRRNGAQQQLHDMSPVSPPPQPQSFYTNPAVASSNRGPPPPPPKSTTSREESPPPPPLPSRPPPDASMRGSQSSLVAASSVGGGSKSLSRQVSSSASEENKENTPSTSSLMSTDSPDGDGGSILSQQQLLHQQRENEKISVKERTKTFNRMASQVDVSGALPMPVTPVAAGPPSSRKSSSSSSAMIKRRNSRAAERKGSASVVRDDRSDDSSSINTIDQNSKLWMVRSAQGDYHTMTKMLLEDPRLAKHKDFTSGFTALHWAAKHGNSDMVKLLAGQYGVDVNIKSHGGYTPLHLACQFGHQDVFDLFVKAYGGDPLVRDNHGKTPRQYMMAQELNTGLSLSSDTFRQLKDRRRNRRQASEKNPSILRFGSLSVKVKKTTEAFNNYFSSSERKASLEGPAAALMEARGISRGGDADRMPPPKFAPIKKRKSKRSVDYGSKVKSAPTTPVERSPSKEFLPGMLRSDDSDSEYGFDSNQWGGAAR